MKNEQIINSEQVKNILNHLDRQEFNSALEKIKVLSDKFPNDLTTNKLFAITYFKKTDWLNAIKYSEKTLPEEKDKHKTYINIGVAYFKLGEIQKSIEAYKNSIKENSSFEIAYNNLAISYIEIGLYEKAFINFTKTLTINKKNYFAEKNLIYLLNFINPKNIKDHSFVEINNKIKKLVNELKDNNGDKIDFLKQTINQSENVIQKYYKDLVFEETQIYRKNSQDLNCKRHFKVFNKFDIIPKFCFSCYKVQIKLKNVVDLIKLYFVFDNINLQNNNTRKCSIELRNNVKGNYKGYIYCRKLDEAKKVKEKLNKILISEKLEKFKIEIKHGCTEYYDSYPEFKKINFEGEQEFNYNENWQEKENIIDKLEPIRSDNNRKILIESSKGINLSDILIIKNWIGYASIIGDNSYKKIYGHDIDIPFLTNLLKNQINFRVEEQKI